MSKQKEEIIKEWFYSWFNESYRDFEKLFSNDVYYSESWGPEYKGIDQIIEWKTKWHRHSKLLKWDIKLMIHKDNVSIVEWYFCNKDQQEKNEFDGVSLITWDEFTKMKSLKEFASSLPHYLYFK